MANPNPRLALAALVPLIYEIARSVCLRKRVSDDEREDFESFLFETFLSRDCRVLERYRGEGPLAGYLRVAICRMLLDYRVRKWGKWRPSAAAKRLGTAAVELERLIECDGLTRMEAVRQLRFNRGAARTELELLELVEQLPHRTGRRIAGEETLLTLPAQRGGTDCPDRCVGDQEARRVRAALGQAVGELPAEDRRLLAQRFAGGSTIADIARRTGENQRRLYRRLERILGELRGRLVAVGVEAGAVRSVLGRL